MLKKQAQAVREESKGAEAMPQALVWPGRSVLE